MTLWNLTPDQPGLMLLACAPALALVIDRLLGDPGIRWHPVAWMGRYLAWAGERLATRVDQPRVLSERRIFWMSAASLTK